jgi:alkanesulfonate monooxygenase SsuD/methylene tetrahydromethanopterin reductase-like flavin-dependent oxidoreductase (luciferase family)
LNTVPSPQERPVVCQAGGSPAGRELAAKHADTIIANPVGIDRMKEYRDDISERMLAHGRKPSDAKVLFLVDPILADTDEDAAAKLDRRNAAMEADIQMQLAGMSYVSGIDFARFQLDAPFPDLTGMSNGHQSMVDDMMRIGRGQTLREVACRPRRTIDLVGSPDSVAAQMGEVMDHVGGDGFLIASPVTRKNITEIADGLAPALRRRRLIRSSYSYRLFRDNLLEF